ncbi:MULTISPECIES: Gfo/Idh/MocA family protein [Providencia]|uniref:Gfo/Idh/MocA family oxidoreductase n=1 Tax=Providencia manganoxydans TaxID=2923283 RepID=A0ABX7AAU6_9GAMM|nr:MULTISPECIES: Gfo/Idh/MocA family oxidoreductase [Providencia]MDX4944146.1 Gfo/Idh/MocA family oxidoreductase [Providencia manganoxydans]QQO60886.1 Gfo/Idh/MocA family oxidoreductase [Providencia manganoxydans]HEF8772658.1 Gfo/Idh/MocA family oxidoreductase [Providencia stuartii]
MKIALIGSGKIIMSALDALTQVQDIEVVALCVRASSIEKGKSICQQFSINKLYSDYEELLRDPQIEVVYIGLPNHLHYDYTYKALMADKHVICEKPFTPQWQQLQELVLLSHQRGLYLFEAITAIHTPGFQFIQQNMEKIGDIKVIQGNYSQYSSRYDDYLLGNVHAAFDPKQAGGALYDINLYNIYVLVALMGEPDSRHYICNKGHNGIDTSGVVTCQFGTTVATCTGAKDSASPGYFIIQGTKGYIRVEGAPSLCQSVEACIDGQVTKVSQNEHTNFMIFEFAFFRDQIASKQFVKCHELLELAIIVSKILTTSRNDVGIVFE